MNAGGRVSCVVKLFKKNPWRKRIRCNSVSRLYEVTVTLGEFCRREDNRKKPEVRSLGGRKNVIRDEHCQVIIFICHQKKLFFTDRLA